MNHYEALVKHPYVERQNKMFILLNNAEPETVETFMIVLDIAEKLCTYIRVLNQIYFLFHTPERAAQELKRSRSWIYTKHEEAVKAFEQGNEEFLNRWVIEQMNNSEQIEQLMNQLYEIQQRKQQVEDEESEIRATLLETMKKEQIEKLENVKIKINYIDKSYRRTVNGKLLRELYPNAFRDCTNRSEVQPHLRVQMMSA